MHTTSGRNVSGDLQREFSVVFSSLFLSQLRVLQFLNTLLFAPVLPCSSSTVVDPPGTCQPYTYDPGLFFVAFSMCLHCCVRFSLRFLLFHADFIALSSCAQRF